MLFFKKIWKPLVKGLLPVAIKTYSVSSVLGFPPFASSILTITLVSSTVPPTTLVLTNYFKPYFSRIGLTFSPNSASSIGKTLGKNSTIVTSVPNLLKWLPNSRPINPPLIFGYDIFF